MKEKESVAVLETKEDFGSRAGSRGVQGSGCAPKLKAGIPTSALWLEEGA